MEDHESAAGDEGAREEKRDFFISFTKSDRDQAEWIAKQLVAANYVTWFQEWAIRPGQNFILEMDKGLDASERLIAVLSPDYLHSVYAKPEWAAMLARDPTGEKRAVIPVRVRDCQPDGLLKGVVYIDLVDLDEQERLRVLLAGVRRERTVSAAPARPDEVEVQPERPITPRLELRPRIEWFVPSQVLGTSKTYLYFDCYTSASAQISVRIKNGNFYTTGESLEVFDWVPFSFPRAGRFTRRVCIQSRDENTATHRIQLEAQDEHGRLVASCTTRLVEIVERKLNWNSVFYIGAFWQWLSGGIRPRWRLPLVLLITILATAWTWNNLPARDRVALLRELNYWKPSPYLDGVSVEFTCNTGTETECKSDVEGHWTGVGAEWKRRIDQKYLQAGELAIKDGEYAILLPDTDKTTLFDGNVTFQTNIAASQTVSFLARVWPYESRPASVSVSPWRTYKVDFGLNSSGSKLEIHGFSCTVDAAWHCHELPTNETIPDDISVGEVDALAVNVTINAHKMTVDSAILSKDGALLGGSFRSFQDDSRFLWGSYGSIGFLNTGPQAFFLRSLTFEPDEKPD